MFTILGGDGKEYGPVTAEQVRAWVAQGRANLETKVKAAGTEEWRRLGDFAEFAGASVPPPMSVSAVPGVAAAPQPAGAVDPKAFADALIARAKPLDVFGCFERAWELLKSDFWTIFATFLVCWLSLFVITCVAWLVPFLNIVVSVVLGGAFYGGYYFFLLKKIRGQTVSVGDGFSGYTLAFGGLALAAIVVALMVILGFALLILPGFYLAVAYSFAYILVIDQRMPFWTAMEVSRRVITSQWWRMLGLLLLGGLVVIAGMIALGIGVFIAMPVFLGAVAYAYEDLCNPPPKA